MVVQNISINKIKGNGINSKLVGLIIYLGIIRKKVHLEQPDQHLKWK